MSPENAETEWVVDPDVDLHDPAQKRETRTRRWDLIAAASAGGVVGALARHGLEVLVPHPTGTFPWSTVMINLAGSLLLGALMVLILDLTSPHRLVRPFLGVGVLGGFTTFSTFAVDVQRLLLVHRPQIALIYLLITVIGCVFAVWLATSLTQKAGRAAVTRRTSRRQRSSP